MEEGEGSLYVPVGYELGRPAAAVMLLHGAGSDSHAGLAPLLGLADDTRLILLAPDARGRTWDLILGQHGGDVALIDSLLGEMFERLAVDRSRLALGGFSDGASYALSLGIANGDLFSHLIAFSPGFARPALRRRGRPAIYVSHGMFDRVLSIDRCSRRIVPQLRDAGYDVRYREFAGAHTVPAEIAADALEWLGAGDPPARDGR